MAELNINEARKIYKYDSLKSLMLTKFSKEELETQEVSQEEFGKTFLEILGKCTKTVFLDAHRNECIVPSNRIELRNDSGEWMFDIQYTGENRHFWVDYGRVWSIFESQYGLRDNKIQRLMKNQMKLLFGITDLTPDDSCEGTLSGMKLIVGMNDITPIPILRSRGK